MKSSKIIRAEEGDQNPDKTNDGQVCGLTTTPTCDESIENQHHVDEPREKGKQHFRISRPDAPNSLRPKRPGHNTERNQREANGERFVRQVITDFELGQPVMETYRMFRLERSLLNQVHNRGSKGDKQCGVSKKNKRRMDVNPIAAQDRRNG